MGPAEHVTDRNAKQNKSLSRLPLHRTSLWGRCIAVHVKDKGNARKITDFLLEIKLAYRGRAVKTVKQIKLHVQIPDLFLTIK